jgi:hypothetical protein
MRLTFIKSRLRDLLREEEGQGLTEYVLILSFAIATAVLLARSMRAALDRGVLLFGGELERDLKTGRTQLGAWKN